MSTLYKVTTKEFKVLYKYNEGSYKNYLLPFWDEEVECVVVEGKRKDFNIYLISNK